MGDDYRQGKDSDGYRSNDNPKTTPDVLPDGAGLSGATREGATAAGSASAPDPAVRKHAEWMQLVDERILELLADGDHRSPSALSEGMTAAGADLDNYVGYVERRCEFLRAAGLLDGDDEYGLSDRGRAYLEGALDAATLPNPRDVD